MVEVSATTMPDLELINLTCYVMRCFEHHGNRFEMEKSEVRVSLSLVERLDSDLKTKLTLPFETVTFILFKNNQLRKLSPETELNHVLHEHSSPIIYLCPQLCVIDDRQESNNSIHCNPTNQNCLQTVFSRLIDRNRRFRFQNEANPSPTNYQPFEWPTATKSFAHLPDHLKHGFVHVYITNQQNTLKEISKIIPMQDDAVHSTIQDIYTIMKEYETNTSSDDLMIIMDGCEFHDENSLAHQLKDKSCPFVTIMRRPLPSDNNPRQDSIDSDDATDMLKAHTIVIRLCVYLIIFDKKYSSNIVRFLNYCDRSKSFTLERRELEICLLTLVELFHKHYENTGARLTYHDLLIPRSNDSTWNYIDCMRIFADTLVEYIRIRHLPLIISNEDDIIMENAYEEISEILQCLDKTLDISLQIDNRMHSGFTTKLKYLCCGDRPEKHLYRAISIILLTCLFLIIIAVTIMNISLYYYFAVPSYEANEMEVFWPLALVISTIIILLVYQTSEAYRTLSEKKKSIERSYTNAYSRLLEAKSMPNKVIITEDPNSHIRITEFISRQQLHPTLAQQSITQSLKTSKTYGEYILSSCSNFIVFCFIILVCLACIFIHPCIPTIHRHLTRNESSVVTPWYTQSIRYSYIVLSGILYSVLIGMMIGSIAGYCRILHVLKVLLSSTQLMESIDLEKAYFLNLREPKNLEYFLFLFRSVKQDIDPYNLFISTMTCALLLNIILILTAVVHVVVYGHSTDLLTIWSLIDIVILSIFIMLFIAVVVIINKKITYDAIGLLRSLKKEMMTSAILHGTCRDNIDYLDVVIEHMEGNSGEYAVRLLGFVVDQKLAVKILISIVTGIISAIISFIKQ